MHEIADCIVVGGGAAGLTAAMYLARFRRKVVLVDAGESRLRLIPLSRNVAGFPEGIAGPQLLARMREHALRYGAQLRQGTVRRLEREPEGDFIAWVAQEDGDAEVGLRARTAVLATGAHDIEPRLEGLADALQAGHLRYCPVCDGTETKGRKVAVLGDTPHAARESCFLSHFGCEVTWLSLGGHETLDHRERARLERSGVGLCPAQVEDIELAAASAQDGPGQGQGSGLPVRVRLASGETRGFDTLYAALGLVHRSELAVALGAKADADGQVEVDDHLRTRVPGLWCIGDLARGVNQIAVAAGHAAIAATSIHNALATR